MRPRLDAALVIALASSSALGLATRAPPRLPGPALARDPSDGPARDRDGENRRCEACHETIAAEWRGSQHHRAWDDPVFLSAYALEPRGFCRSCHAPEANPEHAGSSAERHLGVGCVTCHSSAGDVASAKGLVEHVGAHAVRADARLATAEACAGCHQFEFPVPQRAPMQGTAVEHRASRFASSSCQDCHMPRVGAGVAKHRSHDFRVAGNAEMLRSALAASAARTGTQELTVTLRAARVGHAFPTGDLFRRLELRAHVVGAPRIQATPVVLARRFEVTPTSSGPMRIEVGDDRLPASGEPRELHLQLPADVSGRAIRWEVAYQRMDRSLAALFGVEMERDEVIVAEGEL